MNKLLVNITASDAGAGKNARTLCSYQQFDDFSDMITASKDFKVFTTPGGKKVSFTVKKGDTLPYVIGVYRKTNWKLYMKVRTQNGKIGYVDPLGETRNEKWWGGIRFFWHYM